MKTISLEALLRVMDREKYEELRKRGQTGCNPACPRHRNPVVVYTNSVSS